MQHEAPVPDAVITTSRTGALLRSSLEALRFLSFLQWCLFFPLLLPPFLFVLTLYFIVFHQIHPPLSTRSNLGYLPVSLWILYQDHLVLPCGSHRDFALNCQNIPLELTL
ncbi:hypothetical protein [Cobetia marina]|uniref:hypothetical protein n=1 Tax=Cobetia marina TaxID=28258 RepID=UPI0008653284|nr:hypothetical protein [Cobetia marina]AOM01289.1 hypothetical protein BFX80_08250 [Cobetia marina]